MIALVGNIKLARLIYSYTTRIGQGCIGRRATIPGKADLAGSGNGGNNSSCGNHLTNALVAIIGNIKITPLIHRNGDRYINLGFCRRPSSPENPGVVPTTVVMIPVGEMTLRMRLFGPSAIYKYPA